MKSAAEDWIRLLLVMGSHNGRSIKIVEKYGNAKSAAQAMSEGECEGISDWERRRAAAIRDLDVYAVMDECGRNGIRIVTIDSPDYPALLKSIPNPPIVLFVRGSIGGLDGSITLAAVGTRKASEYSLKAAREICNPLCGYGAVLISGLAHGLDTAVHTCAVENNARTVGVMAAGILENYPSDSGDLKRRIIDCGGAVISELLPRAKVSPSYFHFRNRIISGLAMGTLIIQAPKKSGCLITAKCALQQGRDLFCVPPADIFSPDFAGVIPYLRGGATPVFGFTDILDKYPDHRKQNPGADIHAEIHNSIKNPSAPRKAPEIRSEKPAVTDPPPIAKKPKPDRPNIPNIPEDMEKDKAVLLKLLNEKPQSADELIQKTGMSYADMCDKLMELEIMGYVTLNPDGSYTT